MNWFSPIAPLTMAVGWLTLMLIPAAHCQTSVTIGDDQNRSPVDLVLSNDGDWLATVNQTSNSVSLVDVVRGTVSDEISVGHHPISICLHPDNQRLLVTCRDSGDVHVLQVIGGKLIDHQRIHVGYHPYGVTVAADGKQAYVSQSAIAQIAVIDLGSGSIVDQIAVGSWPRHLVISPDGRRMIVGTPGDRGLSHVDLETGKLDRIERFVGLNIGHFAIDSAGRKAYFPWIVYRRFPISTSNIQRGWVLASRLARSNLDGESRREAISLDPQGEAIADPHGIAMTPDDQRLLITAGGTHEMILLKREGLPMKDRGSTDHVDPELLNDPDRFKRIELGGRPMGVTVSHDGRNAYVANYLLNSVQIVDLVHDRLVGQIDLGGKQQDSAVRRGEAIFFDGRRSLDQWYSCHSCHFEGGVNAVTMDTFNDDSARTYKTVLPLYQLDQSGPWTWHGRQNDLPSSVSKSITSTLQGQQPSDQDVADLVAYLSQLPPPSNPFERNPVAESESIRRGRDLFENKAGCAGCHSGPRFTDGELHDLDLATAGDRYLDFNTPTLTGLYERVLLLHDGRAKSLTELLTKHHAPEDVAGERLSESELIDLIEFLKTL